MIKNLLVLSFILITVGVICFWAGIEYDKYRIPNDYKYWNEIPNFSKFENDIIRKTFNQAIQLLDSPGGFYITEVSESDSGFILNVAQLGHLQSGVNSNGSVINVAFDGNYRFKFTKDYKMITDSTELAKQIP